MGINSIGGIRQITNMYFPNSEYRNEEKHIFTTKNTYSSIPSSYLSSEKYFELKNYIKKYDLCNKKYQNNQKLNFAVNARKNFQKEYGIIKSSTMQDLVLSHKSKKYDYSLNFAINNMRKECRKNGNYYKNLKNKIKAYKIGNCTDVAAISAFDINKTNKNYDAKIVYASILKKDEICNHAAVVIEDKSSNKKINSDTIILDNWLGGVFTYKDWCKIVKKIYSTNSVYTYISNEQIGK